MPAIVDTAAALGSGDYDAQLKIVEYGPAGQEERAIMRWNAALGLWIGQERVSISLRDAWIMDAHGFGVGALSLNTWGYVTKPRGNPGQFGQSSYSFSPQAIRHADAAFAAGLTLQERIITTLWLWEPSGTTLELATVLYPMGPGDQISNVSDPSSHIGVSITALHGQRRIQSTGWVNSGKQSSTRPNLAPHLYSRHTVEPRGVDDHLEHLTAYWRWVVDPTP